MSANTPARMNLDGELVRPVFHSARGGRKVRMGVMDEVEGEPYGEEVYGEKVEA